MIIGPLLGGIIYKRAGYYALFLTLLAVIVLAFVLRLINIEIGDISEWRDVERGLIIQGSSEQWWDSA